MSQHLKLKFFADFIEKELGIIYSETNYFQLEHRLNNITTLLGFKDLEDLYNKAKSSIDGQMRALLLDLATNNETSFYRDQSIFKALSEHMIPELLKIPGKSSLNLWSAASSSGQEAYSVTMELELYRVAHGVNFNWHMLVSDVSDTILKRAQSGVYSQLEVQRGLPARQLVQFFEKEGEESWRVKSELRSHMDFKKINLLQDWGLIGPFDIVFCRNVLIYQNVDNKKKVIENILKKLNPGGYLILGAAESLLGLSDSFEQVVSGTAILYRKKN